LLAIDASSGALLILKNFLLIRRKVYSISLALVIRMLPDADSLAPILYLVRTSIQEPLGVVLGSLPNLDEVPHQTIFHITLDAKTHRSKEITDSTKLRGERFT
jgi:hypothetical protein